MRLSFLIVTRNRPKELQFTLQKLALLYDALLHEILVFSDGCQETENLIVLYPWVKWEISPKSIGASAARAALYKKAVGTIFIGLDDDAHPISANFIASVETFFASNSNAGIIAFQEVRGIFSSDEKAIFSAKKEKKTYLTNDFVGCGFAIQKAVYDKTRGFPEWIDIYGEESCVAVEVLDLGYDIFYCSDIIVNHRVDKIKRAAIGRNYFRFEKQLKNTIKYYIVYYPNPVLKIGKLLYHNFKKYAIKDWRFFRLFLKSIFSVLYSFPTLIQYRKPLSKSTIVKMKHLKNISY